MTCVMCSRSVTQVLSKIPCVYSVKVNLISETADVSFNPNKITIKELGSKINKIGFEYLGIKDKSKQNNVKIKKAYLSNLKNKRNRIIVGFLFSIPLMLLMFMKIKLPIPMSEFMLIITLIPFIYVTYPIFKSSFHALMVKNLNMDVMYALGIGVAYISSLLGTFNIFLTPDFMFYDTSLMLGAFLMLGKYLEDKAKFNTSSTINKLMDLQVNDAVVERRINGKLIEKKQKIESILKGNVVIVKPGEKIPLDGLIIDGKTYVDESLVTGESSPVQKELNDSVVAGSININGSIKFKVTNTSENTILSQIIDLVEIAQNSNPPVQKIADKIIKIFIPSLLIIAVITFSVWYFIFGSSLLFSLTMFISVVVVACPCSLGLATPTAVTVGIGRAAEYGILIKQGEVLEKSDKIDTVLLDKTGTITTGHPVLTDLFNYSNKSDDEILKIITSIEKYSQHPIATAIIEYASSETKLTLYPIKDFKILEGKGISATINNQEYYVGNINLMNSNNIKINENTLFDLKTQENLMKTTVFLSSKSEVLSLISVSDKIKNNTKKAIKSMYDMSMNVIMITGDNNIVANNIAKEVGIDTVISEVLPNDKFDQVKKLQETQHKVAFIGDGINDAPALVQANVGIAIGQGTDVAIESADVILVEGDINDAVGSIQLSKKVMSRIRQNLFWAFAYNIILIPISAGLLIPWHIIFRPEYSAFSMALSSVTVVILSLLLKKYIPPVFREKNIKN